VVVRRRGRGPAGVVGGSRGVSGNWGGWDWRGRALGETARWARLSASCWAFCFGEQGKPVSGDYAFVPITIK